MWAKGKGVDGMPLQPRPGRYGVEQIYEYLRLPLTWNSLDADVRAGGIKPAMSHMATPYITRKKQTPAVSTREKASTERSGL